MYRVIGLDRGASRVEVKPLGKRCSFDRAMLAANNLRDQHEITAVFQDEEFVVGVNGTEEDTNEMMKRAKDALLKLMNRTKINPLYFCADHFIVGVSPTCIRCTTPMVELNDEQKAAYVERGVAALTDKKFLLWKDEGGVGPVSFHKEDPDAPRDFVFTPSAPIGRSYVPADENAKWVTKKEAKQIAKSIGLTFREG